MFPRKALVQIYLAMIRPILEFGDVIFDSCSLATGQAIESIQRQAALICTGGYRHTSYASLLSELNWQSLTDRRRMHKLILFYKIYYNIYPPYLHSFLTYNPNIRTLRTTQVLRPRQTRLAITTNSYFPSTTRAWNSLPSSTQSAVTLLTFKRLIGKRDNKNKYVSETNGRAGSWLARLRMGLSALNHHRYTYNFISSPTCILCNTGAENTHHFLFTCPAHTQARNILYGRLHNELDLDINIGTAGKEVLLHTILYGRGIHPRNYQLLHEIVYQYLHNTTRFI